MISTFLRSAACAALLVAVACGRVPAREEKQPPAKTLNSVSASGRVTGGGMTMDVQLGAPVQQGAAPATVAPAAAPEVPAAPAAATAPTGATAK